MTSICRLYTIWYTLRFRWKSDFDLEHQASSHCTAVITYKSLSTHLSRPVCAINVQSCTLYTYVLRAMCRKWHIKGSTNKLCGRPPQYAPAPLTFDLLTLKVVSESHVTWATSLPINFSLPRPLCSRLRPDERDRQTSNVRQRHHLMPPPRGRGIIKNSGLCHLAVACFYYLFCIFHHSIS